MTERKVPVQSLIDHIKTAVDVDPWAKEMAEELLKEQEAVVRCKDCKWFHQAFKNEGRCITHDNDYHDPNWYCISI